MRRVVLCFVALAVLVPAMANARTRFQCDVDLIVREHCCCPPKKVSPLTSTPAMRTECCKIERRAATVAPFATAVGVDPLPMPVATAVAITAVIPSWREVFRAITPRAQAPPPLRSLLSQYCALLV